MKVAILAGGTGTRLAEETEAKPKPMVEIGDRPILWHVMMHYSHHGFSHFVIALGYKGEVIREYISERRGCGPSWSVELIDTGASTQTGGRTKRLAAHLGEGTFMLTYGDGLSNVDLRELLAFHRSHGKLATLTAVHPPARFGHLRLDGNQVAEFAEKPRITDRWINGAFFVVEPEVLDYIDGDDTQWEREPLERLAREGQLMAYRHASFWQCMDTVHEKRLLEELWLSGGAPWKTWE